MIRIGGSPAVPWLVAVVGFPIGGYLGHLVAGPAATVPAAALSGLIAGGIIGLGQAIALGLRGRPLGLWAVSTGAGLAFGLALLSAVTGQIENMAEAMVLGAVSGLAIGAGQAALLKMEGLANSWAWIPATAVGWSLGWLTTSSIGVVLEAGWPVFGLSGALVSQVITAAVVWLVLRRRLHAAVGA